MPPTLSSLLADPGAIVELIVGGTYLDATNTPHTIYYSQTGWRDPVLGYCYPYLSADLTVRQLIDTLNPSASFDTYSEIALMNDLGVDGLADAFSSWWRCSVDQRAWNIYAVGTLSDGTRVELSDVLSTPLFPLLGMRSPVVDETDCMIQVRSSDYILDTPLQPDTYSPPCLVLPGTTAAAITLGDNLDITASCAFSIQFTTDNPAYPTTAQYLLHKDSGTTGYYVAVGLVGGGTVAGGVEVCFRGRSTPISTSAAGLLRAGRSYTLDISEDTAAGTRRVDLDGATIITVSSLTGSLTSNSVSLTFGMGLLGKLGRVIYWNAARSLATMSAEIRVPFLGTESGLTALFLHNEGVGSTTHDIKTGSSLTGTLGTGALWGNSSWHYLSLLGQYAPLLLGTVLRAPVTWVDTTKQIAEISHGGVANILELQSNHAAVTAANWAQNLRKGILTLSTGTIFGTYSTTATANNFWNSALLFTSTSTASASFTSPTGNRSMAIQYRPDLTATTQRYLIGWQNGGGAGMCILRLSTGGVNRLMWEGRNDAATSHVINYDALTEGLTYSIAISLNTTGSVSNGQPANTAYLYVNGELVGQVALTGTWTTALTTFGVGERGDTHTLPALGRIDEPLIYSRTITQVEARALHVLPESTGKSGLVGGWHLDESTGTTAAPFAGATSLTLANITWVGGRSAPTDLARWIYYQYGYTESDLDTDTWRQILNSQPADCGLSISAGMTGRAALDIILGGLGIVRIETGGVWYLYRFEGVPASPSLTLTEEETLEAAYIEAEEGDAAVWEWHVIHGVNNTPMEQSTVAQSLAASDPERYQYGAQKEKTATRSDYSIRATAAGGLGRFPNALSLTRTTALLYTPDAEREAARLLALHRYGAEVKTVAAFLVTGSVRPLLGIAFVAEDGRTGIACELDVSNWVVIGPSVEDSDRARVTIWRPGVNGEEDDRGHG